ncbi:zwei Ig domain protein zig-8-like [Penaeus japonicus]|uniref:zwei Ig domain protein zig-8-like n=1 Tax=Penaeus japonicus TaxID=27405 RepID=UPI001C71735F|nr:zwei Ig domain protein zig-8-like [Penaeus japonicus]
MPTLCAFPRLTQPFFLFFLVSWVRHRDIHVLTVGRFTFTNDDRFEAHHEDGSNEWVLKLRYPTTNDSGIYECQINTKPTRTQLITLDVVEPQAVITAGHELYLNLGSRLQLTCRVVNAPTTSEFLLWYHEEKVANYDVEHVEVTMSHVNGTTVSTLTLEEAQVHNSGTYTCSPSNAREASVLVHVLRAGEHPAAMQTNASISCLLRLPSPSLSTICLLCSCCLLQQTGLASLLRAHSSALSMSFATVATACAVTLVWVS